MKWRTTLILLVLAVAGGAYIKFFELGKPSEAEEERQSKSVVNFERDKLSGIVIENGDDKIDIRKAGDKWRLEAPIKDQADSSAVDMLLASLAAWQKETTIPEKEINSSKGKLEEFGLEKPKLRLKLTGEKTPPAIFFGKDAALENKMYVRFENSKDVFIVSQSVRKEVDKKADDLRDRKLTDLVTGQVGRLVLKTPAGEMEIEKKGEHWDILKPLRARADDQKVGDLIAQVTTARIQQFVADDHGDLHPYGLAEPRGSITLFGPEDKTGQILQIGGPAKEKDQVYVRSAARGFVYSLPNKIEGLLKTQPNDLRDRHLVRFDTNILDRITIDAAGKGKTVLARKEESWTMPSRNNAPADAGEARRLIDMLKQEQVKKFVEDVASNLPKYGLDKPALQITLSSFASENTAETKAGENPIATIAFGKVEGDMVYARLGDEPFIVAVRRALLDEILVDPLQWQELAIFSFKTDQIHRLSVNNNGVEQALMRGPKNEWSWAKGTGTINQVNVQSLLNTLAKLHGVRWIGATLPQHGFDKPQVTIVFTTSPDDKASHKLMVGGPAGNGMWFAKVDEREGTFVLSNPDFNALRLPLAAEPVAAPVPNTSVSPSASPSPSSQPR